MPFLLCFGLGYSAWPIARRAQARGWKVLGTSRDAEKAAFLSAQGVPCTVFRTDCPLDAALVQTATHCLVSLAPESGGDAVLRTHGADLAQASLRWLGYLSTTGVYGDHQGQWVDENSPCHSIQKRSCLRLLTEMEWQSRVPVAHVFRLAGIYGPGRSALESVQNGTARRIVKPGQFFSRIHVADLAAAVDASMMAPHSGGRLYNVADDEPAPPQDVIDYACRLLGRAPLPDIPFEKAPLSPMGRMFYEENKRVSNRRMKAELVPALHCPSYREGLTAQRDGATLGTDYFPLDLPKK